MLYNIPTNLFLLSGYPSYGYYPNPGAAAGAPAPPPPVTTTPSNVERGTTTYYDFQQNASAPAIRNDSPLHRGDSGQVNNAVTYRSQRKAPPPQPILMRSDMYSGDERVKTYVTGKILLRLHNRIIYHTEPNR